MRRTWLCLFVVVSAAAPAWAQSNGFETRSLTAPALQNVIAFTRLYGYVRYFHPSDEASLANWEGFAIDGMQQVEAAATPADLASTLEALFRPVAPTVRVYPSGHRPDVPPALRPADPTGLSVVRWDYLGFPSSPPSPYKGSRIRQPVLNGAIPAGFPDPASPFEADLGAGVSCFVPIAVYTDAQGTLPRPDLPPRSLPGPPYSANDRAMRLAAVALLWNIPQHFYSYFDVVNTDWQEALGLALASAAVDPDEPAFYATLRRLGAALKDGHVAVYRMFSTTALYVAPIAWDWIEGNLVVTYVADPQGQTIRAGDAILSLDGQPVTEALAQAESLISGATRQWIRFNALAQIGTGIWNSSLRMEIESGGELRTVVMRRTALNQPNAVLGSVPEPRPQPITELEPGIFYVDVTRATNADWTAALSRLATASGIVVDFRGYPQIFPEFNLTRTPIRSPQLLIPKPALPDGRSTTFQDASWPVQPAQPYLAARRVFLTDGRAISAAETHLAMIENYQMGEIVGSPTAGTDGYVASFTLFGRYSMGFTGQKMLKHNGAQYHGIGVSPSVPILRTRAGVAADRDEVLERGLELLRNPGARPVGPWVGSSASWLVDSACPGAVVTILAPAIGPQDGAGLRLNEAGLVDTALNEVRVRFDGIPAPLLYAGPRQVNAVVPYGVAGKANARMVVEHQGREILALGVAIAPSAPALFTANSSGTGQGAILNQDSTPNSASNPAERGSWISLYATGEGLTDPAGVDGRLATAASPKPQLPVLVRIGGFPAVVQYAGAAPGLVAGVLQVNARVPLETPPGNASIFLTVGDAASQPGVTVSVR